MLFYWRAQLVEILPFSWKTLGTLFLMQTNIFCHNIILREVLYYHLYYLAALKGNVQSRNEKHILSMSKKTKWGTDLPLGFAYLINPSKGSIIARRGRVISGRLANRFGSRKQNYYVELLALFYAEWLSKYSIRWCGQTARELKKQCPPTVPTGKVSTCVSCFLQFSPCVWKVFSYNYKKRIWSL